MKKITNLKDLLYIESDKKYQLDNKQFYFIAPKNNDKKHHFTYNTLIYCYSYNTLVAKINFLEHEIQLTNEKFSTTTTRQVNYLRKELENIFTLDLLIYDNFRNNKIIYYKNNF